jgi:hypothetical protein
MERAERCPADVLKFDANAALVQLSRFQIHLEETKTDDLGIIFLHGESTTRL